MMTKAPHRFDRATIAGASNGSAAVAVIRCRRDVLVYSYAPASLGAPERADEMRALYEQAKRKLIARERAA